MEEHQHLFLIGNKGKDTKRAFTIVFCISFCISCIVFYSIRSSFEMIWTQCTITLVVFVICFISWTAFLSMYVRYIQIDDNSLLLADSTQMRMQFAMVSNVLFHTHFEVITTTISLANIVSVKIYPVVDTRISRFSGYDQNKEKGYRIFMKFVMNDDCEFILHDWFYYRDPMLLPALQFLESKGIRIIDPRHILDIINCNISLADYLNGKVNL